MKLVKRIAMLFSVVVAFLAALWVAPKAQPKVSMDYNSIQTVSVHNYGEFVSASRSQFVEMTLPNQEVGFKAYLATSLLK